MHRKTQAVFLDKDGTLVENIPNNFDTEKIRFMPGVRKGLKLLKNEGYRLVILTNQPGIGKGLVTEKKFMKTVSFIRRKFSEWQLELDGFYFCPHYGQNCGCSKPNTGMIEKAARELKIDTAESWIVGDILNDIEAGKKAGCKAVLLNSGGETVWHFNEKRVPDYIAADFFDAAAFIKLNTAVKNAF